MVSVPAPRLRHLALASLLVWGVPLLAACGDDAAGPSDEDSTLEGTSWLLDTSSVDVDGVEDVAAPLSFTADTASGSTGCNSFSGSYTTSGSDLEFGELATTLIGCAPPLSELESTVLAQLDEVRRYSIDGDQLLLQDSDGDTLLTYDTYDPGAALLGGWEVTGYLDEANQAFTSPVPDTTVTVTFADDGTVSGSAGCNEFNGTYEVTDGTLSVGALASTKKLCPEPEGVMEQEALVLANLEAATAISQEANGVVLLDADGTRVLALAPTG